MTEARKRVQCWTAQCDNTVERHGRAQQKWIRASMGQEPTTLGVTGLICWINVIPRKPDQWLRMNKSVFEQTMAGLSIRFRPDLHGFPIFESIRPQCPTLEIIFA